MTTPVASRKARAQPYGWLLTAILALAVGCSPSAEPEGTASPGTPGTTAPETAPETAGTATEPDDDSATCSAAETDTEIAQQDALPEAVADTRAALADAARDCDYERLVELTGEEFRFSFGIAEDPAAFWQREEASGSEPLRFLVELLDRPFGTTETEEGTHYVWPSAFAYDSWGDVPEADREALRPLYDDDDFAGFEQFGGYTGYRVGIRENGDWLFFVAGD